MAEIQKTKICKHCKTEIPAGAKVCPNCRKKQSGKIKNILVILIAIVIIASFFGGRDDEVKKVSQTKEGNTKTPDIQEDAKEEKSEFHIGETAEQKGVQITLMNVTESAGSEYVKPDDGNIFLVCEFEISNNSEIDITISSIANFEAYCDDYSINQDIMGLQAPETEGKNQLDGSVAAGKKMNGIIAYQVPSKYKALEISVAPDFWSSKDIKFIYSK